MKDNLVSGRERIVRKNGKRNSALGRHGRIRRWTALTARWSAALLCAYVPLVEQLPSLMPAPCSTSWPCWPHCTPSCRWTAPRVRFLRGNPRLRSAVPAPRAGFTPPGPATRHVPSVAPGPSRVIAAASGSADRGTRCTRCTPPVAVAPAAAPVPTAPDGRRRQDAAAPAGCDPSTRARARSDLVRWAEQTTWHGLLRDSAVPPGSTRYSPACGEGLGAWGTERMRREGGEQRQPQPDTRTRLG